MNAPAVPTFALIGNPNVGKSTLFNSLTGLNVRTGNYPGVTIDITVGTWTIGGHPVQILDLPGTYSLAPQSPDEQVVYDLLAATLPAAPALTGIIAVVDAGNLQRNLYLVSQLLELHRPVIIALNQIDQAVRRGIAIDLSTLSQQLGVPVVPMQAHRGIGRDALATAARQIIAAPHAPPEPVLAWPEAVADALTARLAADQRLTRSAAIRAIVDHDKPAALLPDGTTSFAALEAGVRYGWARALLSHTVSQAAHVDTTRDRWDALFTHPVWGSLTFIAVMLLVFQALYTGAAPLMEWIDGGVGAFGQWIGGLLPDGMLRSLVVDGIIGGVGSVVIFLPQIMLLFACIAILEDCGYMARSAFLMDRIFSRVGLSGKSFIPLLSSYACAIPGVMATRTIEHRRDRLATIAVAPLMSCSARLPVYVLFIGAFIPAHTVWGVFNQQGLLLAALYSVGLFVAIPVVWLLKRTSLCGATPPFVMELPAYKWPAPRVVLARVLDRARDFLAQAGTIICAISIVIWALAYFPHSPAITKEFDSQRVRTLDANFPPEQFALIDRLEAAALLEDSYLGRMGHWIAPAVEPLGWDWRIGMATIASFPAREVIVAVLGTTFQVGSDADEHSASLIDHLRAATWPDGTPLFTIPTALSIMIFFALCCQCAATLVAIRRETQSWNWALFTFGYMTALAYLAALLTYQIGSRI